ncbi:MAG: DJ-1/PfpI family protein [Planctomycetota bacterium]
MGEKTLAILYPGCVAFEIGLALELLSEELPVEAAGPAGVPRVACAGLLVEPHLSFAEVRVSDYRAVIVPGGDPESIMRDAAVDDVLREADERGLLIGGICAGVLVLAKSRILRGRRITHNYTLDHGPREIVAATERFFEGAVNTEEPLVVDGNVITAMPAAYVEFAVSIAERLGLCDAGRAAGLLEYYRGRTRHP